MAVAVVTVMGSAQLEAGNIAVIDTHKSDPPPGSRWCELLEDDGHTCTVFPVTGPDAPLDPFDVIIDLSEQWADPTGMLADAMRAGKGVITWDRAPQALGIQTDAVVQAWVGANGLTGGDGFLETVTTDPILGDLSVGSVIGDCGFAACAALTDTSGHPHAKVLARNTVHIDSIGLMRNAWERGESVYAYRGLFEESVILGAIAEVGSKVPAVSTWGVVVTLLLILGVGTIAFRQMHTSSPRAA